MQSDSSLRFTALPALQGYDCLAQAWQLPSAACTPTPCLQSAWPVLQTKQDKTRDYICSSQPG